MDDKQTSTSSKENRVDNNDDNKASKNSQASEKQDSTKSERDNNNLDNKTSDAKIDSKQADILSKDVQKASNDVSIMSKVLNTTAKASDSSILPAGTSNSLKESITKLDAINTSNNKNIETLSSAVKTDSGKENLNSARSASSIATKNIGEASEAVNNVVKEQRGQATANQHDVSKAATLINEKTREKQPLPTHPPETIISEEKIKQNKTTIKDI